MNVTRTMLCTLVLAGVGCTLSGAQQKHSVYPPNAVPAVDGVTIPGLPPVTGRIVVDQFGYLPELPKVAVLTDPQKGYNASDDYAPGPELEVRERASGKTVLRAAPRPWRDGATDEISGDKGWWLDFSAVTTPGEYYLFDPAANLRSPLFKIGPDVYAGVLRAAVRMFYYQRENMPLDAKYAGKEWADKAIYPQDTRARAVWAKEDASTERNLAGGWMDAGDTNKYPTFLGEVIHPLLYAYRANPSVFTDDFGIPESGNGLPDLLDEIKYELEWLQKMQDADGGVFIKLGNITHNSPWPLATDSQPRYYGHTSSASTLWAAGVFAHAARVYSQLPAWKPFADQLKGRALRAWAWYKSHPRDDKPDNGEIKSGLANRSAQEQDNMEANVAVHLFALTGATQFDQVVQEKAPKSRQLGEGVWGVYEAGAGEALIDYANLPKANPALAARVRKQLARSAASPGWAPPADADLYRAWMPPTAYHWGSCQPRASCGFTATQAARDGNLAAPEQERLRARGADILHYFHGVNPFSAVLLSHMEDLGATRSLQKIYHSRWGESARISAPPPGYVVGGPSTQISGKSRNSDNQVEWLKQQPKGKSYADTNLGWPEASWEFSEPAIYYQALYIRLLTPFVHRK